MISSLFTEAGSKDPIGILKPFSDVWQARRKAELTAAIERAAAADDSEASVSSESGLRRRGGNSNSGSATTTLQHSDPDRAVQARTAFHCWLIVIQSNPLSDRDRK